MIALSKKDALHCWHTLPYISHVIKINLAFLEWVLG